MRSITPLLAVPFFVVFPLVAAAQDSRELVKLPAPMQEHMLSNMRDHLVTLNEIIGDVAEEKYDQAAKLVEQRLGMSSLPAHDAAHMAPFMPKPMQDMGTNMHHAASQLVIVLQDASIAPDAQSMRAHRSSHSTNYVGMYQLSCCLSHPVRCDTQAIPISN
jgi:hypothetical protein